MKQPIQAIVISAAFFGLFVHAESGYPSWICLVSLSVLATFALSNRKVVR